jgi:EXLDI family protein
MMTSPGRDDADVPNKTIYVSDGDMHIFQRAQELAGGNLSAAIAGALRRYVDIEDGRRDGFDEISIRIGPEPGRRVRFVGLLLGEWEHSTPSRTETYRVYRGRTGRFVLHVERSPEHTVFDGKGKPAGWLANLGLDWSATTTMSSGQSTVDVIESLEVLRELIPPELYEIVGSSAGQPAVEDLDV